MKKRIAIGLIWVMLMPLLIKITVIVDFQLNRDLIAEVFCVNRDKPMTVCGGKCYLTQRLEQSDPKSSVVREILETEFSMVYEPQMIHEVTFCVHYPLYTYPKIFISLLIPQGYLSTIFHPPRFFS